MDGRVASGPSFARRWADQADGRMASPLVIEHIDVVEQLDLRLGTSKRRNRVVGASSKGLGAAGLDMDKEIARARALMKAAAVGAGNV